MSVRALVGRVWAEPIYYSKPNVMHRHFSQKKNTFPKMVEFNLFFYFTLKFELKNKTIITQICWENNTYSLIKFYKLSPIFNVFLTLSKKNMS